MSLVGREEEASASLEDIKKIDAKQTIYITILFIIYRLNMKCKIKESKTMIIMHVVIGRCKLKFFRSMQISPGSFPSHGILSKKRKRIPIAIISRPIKIIDFATILESII